MSLPWAALGRLAAAGAVALAAARWLPLPADNPLRTTLAILPLVCAALAESARAGARRGGRAIAPRAAAGELAAVAALTAAALARPHLGFEVPAEVIVGGLVVVLADRVARQLLALRPLLGAALPDRPSALFFLLPLTVYLALLPWSAGRRPPDGDEPYYLLITHSLAYDFDADLTNNYAAGDWRHFLDRQIRPQPGDPVGPHGELYSRHNELLPLALAPAYRLAGAWGALATMAALSAALAWVILRLARHYGRGRPGEALAAYGLAAFAPPLLLFSYQVWVEVPAALLTALALDRILATRGRSRHAWQGREWLGIGLPLLLLPLLKIRFMLLAVPLLALGWWHAGRPRKPVVLLGVALAAVGGAILVHNQLLYGNPLKIHQWGELQLTDYSLLDYARGSIGMFFDTGFGLFASAPLWLILIPTVLLAAARRHPVLLDLAVLSLAYGLVIVPRIEWFGGWSPPFRYALVVLPLLALTTVPLLVRRRRGGARALVAALAALTLILTVLWVAVPGWTYNFADGRNYLLDRLDARLGADLARFFPSSVRPREATWAWPLAALVAVPLVWWRPRRLRRPALWGTAGLLAATAALALAAERLPTRVVEFEDPWVTKTGGHLHPDRWVIERPRYQGGWVLRGGEEARAPVVAGGGEVTIRLHVDVIKNRPATFGLELQAGRRVLHTWRVDGDPSWEWLTVGPVSWPAGEPLVVAAFDLDGEGPANGVILDRAELDWRRR